MKKLFALIEFGIIAAIFFALLHYLVRDEPHEANVSCIKVAPTKQKAGGMM
jgi:hypothetical protein